MCNLYRMEDKDCVSMGPRMTKALSTSLPANQMNIDQMGAIVRHTVEGKKKLVHARWALPSPRFALEKGAKTKAEKLVAEGKPVDLEELIRMEQ